MEWKLATAWLNDCCSITKILFKNQLKEQSHKFYKTKIDIYQCLIFLWIIINNYNFKFIYFVTTLWALQRLMKMAHNNTTLTTKLNCNIPVLIYFSCYYVLRIKNKLQLSLIVTWLRTVQQNSDKCTSALIMNKSVHSSFKAAESCEDISSLMVDSHRRFLSGTCLWRLPRL